MQEELSFLKLPGFLKLKDPRILSLKMFPVCYRMTKAGRFAPSSVRFLNWGTMSVSYTHLLSLIESQQMSLMSVRGYGESESPSRDLPRGMP